MVFQKILRYTVSLLFTFYPQFDLFPPMRAKLLHRQFRRNRVIHVLIRTVSQKVCFSSISSNLSLVSTAAANTSLISLASASDSLLDSVTILIGHIAELDSHYVSTTTRWTAGLPYSRYFLCRLGCVQTQRFFFCDLFIFILPQTRYNT